MQNLDQWSLRKSWLELQLMIKQVSKEVNHISPTNLSVKIVIL